MTPLLPAPPARPSLRNLAVFLFCLPAVLRAPGQHTPSPLDRADLSHIQIHPSDTIREIAANEGAAALQQSLVKLSTRASILLIVAHPDDEDGGMLTAQSRGLGARTAMLTLTRGEGGQNVMTGDFNAALGLERTQELLAADRYMGVDQIWGTEVDFGFSKTKEEAFAQWTHERVLYDAVRAVRLYRPLVLAAVFIGGVTDGHGQHQVSGEITQEVFTAAADPKVFPEMGLAPWAPLKVYARNPTFAISAKGLFDYATGKYTAPRFHNYVDNTDSTVAPNPNVVIHEGDYSPVLGMSYLQFARLGLGLQKTQNGGMGIPQAGAFDVAYHRYGARIPALDTEATFYDGIDTSVQGIASLAPNEKTFLPQALTAIATCVARAAEELRPQNPSHIAPLLREGLNATNALLGRVETSSLTSLEKTNLRHELTIKQTQFNDALLQALGLSLRAQVAPATEPTGPFAGFGDPPDSATTAVPGDSLTVSVRLVNGSPVKLTATKVWLATSFGPDIPARPTPSSAPTPAAPPATSQQSRSVTPPAPPLSLPASLERNVPGDLRIPVTIPATATPTEPPFTQPNSATAHYDLADPGLRNASQAPWPLTAWAAIDYDGTPLHLGQVVQTAHHVPGLGSVYDPLILVPALSVSVTPAAGVVPLGEKSFPVAARVASSTANATKGTLALTLPRGWTATPASVPFTLSHEGETTGIVFTVTPAHIDTSAYTVTAVATAGGHDYREGFRAVGYPTLRPTGLFRPANSSTRGVDVKVAPNLRIAYLEGSGDEVPASLISIGVHVTPITPGQLTPANLQAFDAVLLGVRAYAAHPDLAFANPVLLAYANAGGVVVVQYNTAQYGTAEAPFPLTVPGTPDHNVVVETAPVTLLQPNSALFTWPNQITAKDFDGWIEERGHGFAATFDPRYQALTEAHDPEQDPQKGGLLYARTGKGAYVYVAYALYRQLPEGVPGAYRLFANLLSLAHNAGAGIGHPEP